MTTKTSKAAKAAKSAIAEVKTNVPSMEPVKNNKEVAQEEATKANLANLRPKSSLFISHASGTKSRDSIYRDGIIPPNKKSSARKAIRKTLDLFAEAAEHHANDPKTIKLLKSEFDDYYKSVFKLNDYSVGSILNGNTKDGRKGQIQSMLEIFLKVK